MDWLTVADMNFRSRNSLDFVWYLGFTVRTVIYGYVLLHVFRFMKRKIPRLLGFGPLRRDPNMRKLRRLVIFFHHNCNSLQIWHSVAYFSSFLISIIRTAFPCVCMTYPVNIRYTLCTFIGGAVLSLQLYNIALTSLGSC